MPPRMSRRRFERLVAIALRTLPPALLGRMANVDVLVEWEADADTLEEMGIPDGEELFGAYFGTPLTDRTSEYGMTLPDRVVIYQRPIEAVCNSDHAIRLEVRTTVLHEVAHHFGLSDDDLLRLGAY